MDLITARDFASERNFWTNLVVALLEVIADKLSPGSFFCFEDESSY